MVFPVAFSGGNLHSRDVSLPTHIACLKSEAELQIAYLYHALSGGKCTIQKIPMTQSHHSQYDNWDEEKLQILTRTKCGGE